MSDEITVDLQKAEAFIKEVGIPSPPDILVKLQFELNRSCPDLQDIERCVMRDMGIAARVLKLANSAYFSGKSRVDSIPQAFTRLGMKVFSQVVMSAAAREVLGEKTYWSEKIWDHAEQTAVVCKLIAKELCFSLQEQAYLVGLFHDCGLPMMLKKFHDYANFVDDAIKYVPHCLQLELEKFQFDHCTIAQRITKTWNISPAIQEAILNHHKHQISSKLPPEAAKLTAIVILAENIIEQKTYNKSELFSETGEALMRHLCDVLSVKKEQIEPLPFEIFTQLNGG